MPDFALPEDLATYMQLAQVDTATAADCLRYATGMVRARVGQHVDYVVDDVVVCDPIAGSPAVLLPEVPVVAVTSVELLDYTVPLVPVWVTQTADRWEWTAAGLLTLSRWVGDIIVGPSRFTGRPRSVRVTYTHGYQTIPDELVGVVLGVASRMYANPQTAQSESESIDDYSRETRHGAHPVGFSPLEDAVLGRYTVRNVA